MTYKDIFSTFDEFFNEVFYQFPSDPKPPIAKEALRSDDGQLGVSLQFALAGFRVDEVKVWHQDSILIVDGDNSQNASISDKFKSKFSRRFPVSDYLDLEKTKVDFRDGILMINIPAKEEKEKKKFPLYNCDFLV